MFFKPVGQAIQFGSRESIIDEGQSVSMPQYVIEEPVVALFDGLPQENHPMLSNLLIVDDPDDYGSTYPVDSRQHGTSMASIILRGKNMYRITEALLALLEFFLQNRPFLPLLMSVTRSEQAMPQLLFPITPQFVMKL